MWGEYKIKFGDGFSGVGKTKVNSNNEILPDLPFQRKKFHGGLAKRFFDFNTVELETEVVEEEYPKKKTFGEGFLYAHGRSTSYYEGNILYDLSTKQFISTFQETTYPVFSDCIIFKRLSESKSKVGWVYGSKANNRVRDYTPATIATGPVIIKRFEYQSLTKASLDQTSSYRRDKNYYSKVFKELYETGRPVEFEKKFCCNRCGKSYYTGKLKSKEESPCVALKDDSKNAGKWYTIYSEEDSKINRKITNPLHSQYVTNEIVNNYHMEGEDKKSARIIKFQDLDITKKDWDYRIVYYPKFYFDSAIFTCYQGSLKAKKINARYGLKPDGKPINVKEFSKNNDYWYKSYAYFVANVAQSNYDWVEDPEPTDEFTTQIAQNVVKREEYRWNTYSPHTSNFGGSDGLNLFGEGDTFSFPFATDKGFFKNQWGAFPTDSPGDEIEISCKYFGAVKGGTPHSFDGHGGGWRSTSKSFAHRVKGFSSIELVYADWFKDLYDEGQYPSGTSFLPDPENAKSLTDGELADLGITPKKDTSGTVDEEIKGEVGVQGHIDPFDITIVYNYATTDIDLQMYTPHVFTAVMEYEDVQYDGKNYFLNLPNRDESNLDFYVVKLIDKTTLSGDGVSGDGSSSTGYGYTNAGEGYANINGLNLTTLKTKGFRFEGTSRTVSGISNDDAPDNGSDVPVTFSLSTGYKRVYYYEDTEFLKSPSGTLKSSDIDSSNNGKDQLGGENFKTDDLRQYKKVNVRFATLLAKYSFFAVGTGTDENAGWAKGVFNKYIFSKFIPEAGNTYDIGGEDLDHSEIDKADSISDGVELPDGASIEDAGFQEMYVPMTKEEYEEAYEDWFDKKYPGGKQRIHVESPPNKNGFLCLGDSSGFEGTGHRKYTIKVSRRNVTANRPWFLDKTETTENGYQYEIYRLQFSNQEDFNYYNFFDWDGNYNGPMKFNSDYTANNFYSTSSEDKINQAIAKKKTVTEVSPVWKNVSLPGYYEMTFSNLNRVSSSYAEYVMVLSRGKGKLGQAYNASSAILRPWAGSIVTAAGCCPVRAKNNYFLFGEKNGASKWGFVENTPLMQNRFFGSGATYVNYLGEGVYPHRDGNKFIIVSSWFTDAYEGFAGIELKIDSDFTNFANSKVYNGFSQPCDTALVATYNIAGPLVSAQNIWSKDTSSSNYTVNKGVFPVIKGLWQPEDAESVEYALFMIETQCMIEGPEYYFSTSANKMPPGFESNFNGYKSRGLMVAIKFKNNSSFKVYPVGDSSSTGFFSYFEKQNEKRDKVNVRKAYDSIPLDMRQKKGYYWDCEEAFGLYEISSPYAFETQLAAKMSFSVRVGKNTAVLFLLAYDIDKWPANISSDNPTNDKQFPSIADYEKYKFKSAFMPVRFSKAGATVLSKFRNFTMQYCLRDLVSVKNASDSSLKKQNKKYAKFGITYYPGIILPLNYGTGELVKPQYNYDSAKDSASKVSHGIVRLVRWRTFELDNYDCSIAQLAVSHSNPLTESVDQYYVGNAVLLMFYAPKGTNNFSVENLHIPKTMVWQESLGGSSYREHLIEISSLGMFDTIIIEKKKDTTNENNVKITEILSIPVVTKSGYTYLCVSKDGVNWEISGEIGSGANVHLVAEFQDNV